MQYPNLFSTFRIGRLTLRNRIAYAPISFTRQAPGGGFSDECIALAEAISRGGAGLITVGETIVGNSTGRTHDDIVCICDPKVKRRLYLMAEAIHRHGAAASIEISHGGAMCAPFMNNGAIPLVACDLGKFMDPKTVPMGPGFPEVCKEIDEDDMRRIAEDYADSAEILKDAGYDMVMVHMGHGWLLHQFLSPYFNRRTDSYGGSTENRLRFPLMILDAIRERIGREFPLEVRISGMEPLEGGLTVEEQAIICSVLQEKVDLISVSCGGPMGLYAGERMGPTVFMEHGINVYLAEYIRNQPEIHIPVSAVGAISTPELAEEILRDGKADLIYMGRTLIADHEFPLKAATGREDEIRHCVRCLHCQDILFNKPPRVVRCTVNPTTGYEAERIQPISSDKKVLIAGGGPAGMEAARTAAEAGCSVILCEKSDRLGGALQHADTVSFKEDIHILRERMTAVLEKYENVEIRLNTEVTPELVTAEQPDVFLAAIGAVEKTPDIPGIQNCTTMHAADIYGAEEKLPHSILIIGGGLIGSETALHLHSLGHKVTLLARHSIAADASMTQRNAIISRLGAIAGTYTNTEIIACEKNCIRFKDGSGEHTVQAELVLLATGFGAQLDEAYRLKGDCSAFAAIGDCRSVGNIMNATATAYNTVRDLLTFIS